MDDLGQKIVDRLRDFSGFLDDHGSELMDGLDGFEKSEGTITVGDKQLRVIRLRRVGDKLKLPPKDKDGTQ